MGRRERERNITGVGEGSLSFYYHYSQYLFLMEFLEKRFIEI